MKLRLAKLIDIDILAKLDKESNLTSWSKKSYLEVFNNSRQKIYILEDNNGILGSCTVANSQDEAEILQLWIKQQYKGQGYGKILLKQIIKILNSPTIFLEVRENNIPAIALYTQCGFKNIGLRKNYYQVDNWSFDAIVMRYEK